MPKVARAWLIRSEWALFRIKWRLRHWTTACGATLQSTATLNWYLFEQIVFCRRLQSSQA